MNRWLKNCLNQLTEKPRLLFLIDSLGAFLTAFMQSVLLLNCNEYFGMPPTILLYLSAIAICFCIYSAVCSFLLKQHWTAFIIGIISIANLFYCVLTIGLLIFYYPLLKISDLVYFIAEIVIICGLVSIELKVAVTLRKNKKDSNLN